MKTPSQEGPDISTLARHFRVRAAIAILRGAFWREYRPEHFALVFSERDAFPLIEVTPNERISVCELPNYLDDPAAWGRIMAKELVRWETGEWGDEREHRCAYLSGDGVSIQWGKWAPSLGESVCGAFLAKYGIEVS